MVHLPRTAPRRTGRAAEVTGTQPQAIGELRTRLEGIDASQACSTLVGMVAGALGDLVQASSEPHLANCCRLAAMTLDAELRAAFGFRSDHSGLAGVDVDECNSGLRRFEPLVPMRTLLKGVRSETMGGDKILIVDDSPTESAVLSSLLESVGFSVLTARDGEEAMAIFDTERPRLVLLDIILPGKNGFSLCRLMRAHSQLGRTPVIWSLRRISLPIDSGV